MERIEVETDWSSDPAPSGSKRQDYVTYQETEDYLVQHIRALIIDASGNRRLSLTGYPTLTIHSCWDGYSEYTIEDQWHEVGVEWGGYRLYYDSTSAFLKDLSEVEPVGY